MRKKIIWTISILLLLVLGTIGYYAYSFYEFGKGIHDNQKESIFNKVKQDPDTIEEPPEWEGKERVNILLLGGDSRGVTANEVPRSDTMMIASIDPVTKKASLFSVLRDTYVDIPGNGKDRINAALAYGGPPLAMQTIGDLTGLQIQYYIYTDFVGFVALVDALGGITIDVEKDLKYYDPWDDEDLRIDLKKGLQQLNGNQALQYVRFRHDAMSDYSRSERQRKFMSAVAEKMKKTTSILRLPHVLKSIKPYIETNMSVNDMVKLASLAYDTKGSELVNEQLPPFELLQEKKINGADVIIVNPDKLKEFVQEKFAEAEATPPPDETPESSPTSKAGS